MKTDSLIEELASSAAPVKLASPPYLQLATWLALAILYVGAGVALIGKRPHNVEELSNFGFAMQFFLPLLLSLASAASAFTLGIPNRKNYWPAIAPLSALAACAISLVYLISSSQEAHAGTGLNCLRNMVVLSLPPALLLCFLIQRASPLQVKMVGILAAFGASALACSATRFICPNEDALHFFVWHFVPVLLLGAVGYGLGNALFRSHASDNLKR